MKMGKVEGCDMGVTNYTSHVGVKNFMHIRAFLESHDDHDIFNIFFLFYDISTTYLRL